MQPNEQVIDSTMLSLDHADRGDAAGGQERVVGQAPTPQWEDVYRSRLKDHEGYAYAVARDGRVIAQGEVRFTRGKRDEGQASPGRSVSVPLQHEVEPRG